MPPVEHASGAIDALWTRLHESHEFEVYEAIERLVQAGESVGLDADALVRMLDRGTGFAEVLQMIESRMECSQNETETVAPQKKAA